jgi:hypothetical protein
LENVTISGGTKRIGSYAFQNCRKIKAVALPETVEAIDSGAFYGCADLADVTLPENAKISDGVFTGCKFKFKK